MGPSDAIPVIFGKSGTVSMNEPLEARRRDYESISVSSRNRQHAKNIFVPNVRELLEILAFLPMESIDVERSFSFMQRILTWLRIIMITERLSDLAFIGTYANAVTIDRSVVCEKFVALHPRRMKASSLLDEASISSFLWRFKTMHNLVPRVLSYPPYGARERETLENAGHVAPEQK